MRLKTEIHSESFEGKTLSFNVTYYYFDVQFALNRFTFSLFNGI